MKQIEFAARHPKLNLVWTRPVVTQPRIRQCLLENRQVYSFTFPAAEVRVHAVAALFGGCRKMVV